MSLLANSVVDFFFPINWNRSHHGRRLTRGPLPRTTINSILLFGSVPASLPRQDHFRISLRRLCLPRRVRQNPQPRQLLITTVIHVFFRRGNTNPRAPFFVMSCSFEAGFTGFRLWCRDRNEEEFQWWFPVLWKTDPWTSGSLQRDPDFQYVQKYPINSALDISNTQFSPSKYSEFTAPVSELLITSLLNPMYKVKTRNITG